MKKIILIFFLLIGQFVHAQHADIINNIKIAFKTGSSNELSKYFDSSIDLKILEKEGTYSLSQAKLIIKDFFSKNPPKSFHIVHEGKSKNEVKYYIGTLESLDRSLRIYIYLKGDAEKLTIQELSIEEED